MTKRSPVRPSSRAVPQTDLAAVTGGTDLIFFEKKITSPRDSATGVASGR